MHRPAVSEESLARCAAAPEREAHWRARLAEVRAVPLRCKVKAHTERPEGRGVLHSGVIEREVAPYRDLAIRGHRVEKSGRFMRSCAQVASAGLATAGSV